MQKLFVLLLGLMLTTLFATAGFAVESGTCRCNNGIVSIGDAMVEVIAKCGEPTVKAQREEKRSAPEKKGLPEKKAFNIVTIDEWSYNFGPTAFMYSISFVNGRVERIDSLDYGY